MTSLDKLKVTLLSWDGDKDQPTFADWLDGYSDLIRSLAGGDDELELWLDAKLGRRINVAAAAALASGHVQRGCSRSGLRAAGGWRKTLA